MVAWRLAWCVALVAWVGAGFVGTVHSAMLLAWESFGALGWCGLVGWCACGALCMLVRGRAVANSRPWSKDLGACEGFTKDVQLSGEEVRWMLCGGMAA